MAVALYMDEHVPKAVTIGLRVRGVDVLTAQDDGLRETDDPVLLERATDLGRIMFSFDADMLRETTERQAQGIRFAGLVFTHPERITVGQCIRDLEIIAKAGEPSDWVDQIAYLPL